MSSRAIQMSASLLRAQPAAANLLKLRPAQQMLKQTRGLRLQATPKMMKPMPVSRLGL